MRTSKHQRIGRELVEKYKSNKNVVGIYFFGSMATGKVKENSDIDIEIIFRKMRKEYELKKNRIEGVHIDLSCFSLKGFNEEFYKNTHRTYSVIGKNKIVYDPEGILKKAFNYVEKYFNKNPELREFWEEKEKKYVLDKKLNRKKEYFFDVCKEADKLVK